MKYDEIKSKFIQIFENIAIERGFNPLNGKILALFLLNKESLTQSNLENMTGFSRSAISRSLDQMVRMGTFSKSKKAGSREYFYTIEIDFQTIFINFIVKWLEGLILIKKNVYKWVKEYPNEITPDVSEEEFSLLKKKLEELIKFINEMEGRMQIFLREIIK